MVTLELTEDDLYAQGSITEFDDGSVLLERTIAPYTPQIGDDYYETISDDNYDTLAYLKYDNSKLWHVIANANNIINPFDVLPNTVVFPNLLLNNY